MTNLIQALYSVVFEHHPIKHHLCGAAVLGALARARGLRLRRCGRLRGVVACLGARQDVGAWW